MLSYRNLFFLFVALLTSGCDLFSESKLERASSIKACVKMASGGLRPISDQQSERFLGKVSEDAANCRGGKVALENRDSVWVDWANYWGAGDADSKAGGREGITKVGNEHLFPDGRGVDGALMDLEYQRMELIRFNLYDNNTYELYVTGERDTPGPLLKTWNAMHLPESHPEFQKITSSQGDQVCKGDLIRYRSLSGICNDIYNPAMGSTNQVFARNVSFESTYPHLGKTELIRNRHADRLSMLKPDPQVISRKLFTRFQQKPDACNSGQGLPGKKKMRNAIIKKPRFLMCSQPTGFNL